MIVGTVTSRTILDHPVLVARGFGFACLARCYRAMFCGLWTHRDRTFLSLIAKPAPQCHA